MIRQAGYVLTDAEAAYLDADQAIGQQYSTALLQLVALGGPNAGLPDSAAQPALVAVLQRLLAFDPAASPEAPASLQPLRALAVEQRAATLRAASAWLTALQAGDPTWWQAGANDFGLANQSLQNWQHGVCGAVSAAAGWSSLRGGGGTPPTPPGVKEVVFGGTPPSPPAGERPCTPGGSDGPRRGEPLQTRWGWRQAP